MRKTTNRIINRIPGFYTREDRSVLVAIIDAIVPEIDFLFKNVKRVADIVSIDSVHGDDIWRRFGSMFNTPKYSYEDDIAYRGRIKALVASKYGGITQLIKNTVASYVGITDSNDIDRFIKITGAWEYEGDRIPEEAKRPGYFLCDIDPAYMVDHDVSMAKIVQLINGVKAAGVHVYTTISYSTDKDRTYLHITDDYYNRFAYIDKENVDIHVGIGHKGALLNSDDALFNSTLIINKCEDIISTADEHHDKVEYVKAQKDDIAIGIDELLRNVNRDYSHDGADSGFDIYDILLDELKSQQFRDIIQIAIGTKIEEATRIGDAESLLGSLKFGKICTGIIENDQYMDKLRSIFNIDGDVAAPDPFFDISYDGTNNVLEYREMSADDEFDKSNIVTKYNDDANILVGTGSIGSLIGYWNAVFNRTLIFNRPEDIISNIDGGSDNIGYGRYNTSANISVDEWLQPFNSLGNSDISGEMSVVDTAKSKINHSSIDDIGTDIQTFNVDRIRNIGNAIILLDIVESSFDIFKRMVSDIFNYSIYDTTVDCISDTFDDTGVVDTETDVYNRLYHNYSNIIDMTSSDIAYNSTNDRNIDNNQFSIDTKYRENISSSDADIIQFSVVESSEDKIVETAPDNVDISADDKRIDFIKYINSIDDISININQEYIDNSISMMADDIDISIDISVTNNIHTMEVDDIDTSVDSRSGDSNTDEDIDSSEISVTSAYDTNITNNINEYAQIGAIEEQSNNVVAITSDHTAVSIDIKFVDGMQYNTMDDITISVDRHSSDSIVNTDRDDVRLLTNSDNNNIIINISNDNIISFIDDYILDKSAAQFSDVIDISTDEHTSSEVSDILADNDILSIGSSSNDNIVNMMDDNSAQSVNDNIVDNYTASTADSIELSAIDHIVDKPTVSNNDNVNTKADDRIANEIINTDNHNNVLSIDDSITNKSTVSTADNINTSIGDVSYDIIMIIVNDSITLSVGSDDTTNVTTKSNGRLGSARLGDTFVLGKK